LHREKVWIGLKNEPNFEIKVEKKPFDNEDYLKRRSDMDEKDNEYVSQIKRRVYG
jgi:hypothetical protein